MNGHLLYLSYPRDEGGRWEFAEVASCTACAWSLVNGHETLREVQDAFAAAHGAKDPR